MSRSARTHEEKPKSPSEKLRLVFLKLWEKKHEDFPYFEQYYESKMNKLIEYYSKMLE